MLGALSLAWLVSALIECTVSGNPAIVTDSSISPAFGTQATDDESDLASGLRAIYRTQLPPREFVRIDPDVQFHWADASPDPRAGSGPFEAHWTGKLFVAANSKYRFRLFTAGSARMTIDTKQVIEGTTKNAGWLSSAEIPLELGHHAIEISYAKSSNDARIGLYWESNKFSLEPVGPRWLFHDKISDADANGFERGLELVRAYRCAACHIVPGVESDHKAPPLTQMAAHIRQDWLVRWLEDTRSLRSDTSMPAMGLNADESRAVAAFLISVNKKEASIARDVRAKGHAETGAELFQSLGCMACHTIGKNGTTNLFGGGALDAIAQKRPARFFREWLAKPESINPAHRMPTFALKKEEVEDLASFLATLGADDNAHNALAAITTKDQIDQGKRLIVERRCTACHDIPNLEKIEFARTALHKDLRNQTQVDWSNSCLGNADVARGRPGFRLNERDRIAIESYFAQVPRQAVEQSRYELGRQLFRELNCAACHARDLDQGLQPGRLENNDRQGTETELAKLRGELEPPSLTSVGDKFQAAMLSKLIDGGLPPRRPWLKVRMPRFAHSNVERDALLTFLIEHDRIPTPTPAPLVTATDSPQRQPVPHEKPNGKANRAGPVATLDPAAALVAGHQLVSSRGFGCMSCHTVGKHQPKGVAVNARGSDLLKIGERVRREWFIRWVRDPARIVPGMEMPAITMAIRGTLDDRLDLQLESLWQALNSPSFVVPSDRDTAQEIISLKSTDSPTVLRDVIFDCPPGSGWCPRPFAIGLPNRHNLLFDIDTMSLRAWWIGDFARERTEGKTWLWEPGGLAVWDHAATLPTLALRNLQSGRVELPIRRGQSVGRLRQWGAGNSFEAIGAGRVFFTVELTFEHGSTVTVTENIVEDRDTKRGFTREISLSGIPDGFVPLLLINSTELAIPDGSDITQHGPIGDMSVHSVTRGNPEPKWQRLLELESPSMKGHCLALQLPATDAGSAGDYQALLKYRGPDSSASSPQGVPTLPKKQTPPAKTLRVAPGFDVVHLPLDPSVMPSAIAVQPDGTPVVCSLKGRMFIAKDASGDGLPDTWVEHGDHLAAPFGVLADELGIFVTHKAELLSFREDEDAREKYSRFPEVLATGWGLTEDYHDWTFGLVRGSKGFYIGTGSDYTHKGRPSEARKWRGRILKVSADGEIEEVARGARYPTGLAINHDDQVFFTDNQGVQNTFNEINHVIPGSRYGVPALDDPPPDKDPWPERAPAIKIPHPWTRSINGICFLYGDGKWGPFEGHGIGCEYDTRGLIRFSLQKVGDTYQGACYPFTLPEDQVPQDERLLGPICCAVSPNGDLYVGGLRDSGWGGGNNIGELVRVRPGAEIPLGIREVRAWHDGFVIDFTAPIDVQLAMDPAKYVVSSYQRIWQGTYATPDTDRRTDKIRAVEVSADRKSVAITLESMRPGFVYDLHLGAIGEQKTTLWPAEAYYTLNTVPD